MENSSEDNVDSLHPTCPICMHESEDVVYGPCRHEFCLPCLERFLLCPSSLSSSSWRSTTVTVPTLGLCPMCRQELYLFDIEYAKTGEKVHAKTNGGGTFPEELAGSIFVESTLDHPGSVGRGSFHFPKNTAEAPWYDISKIPRSSGTNHVGSSDTIRFVDYHWHEASRTFAGILACPKPSLLDHFHVILSFSSDWRFVRQGVHVKRRRRNFDSVQEIQRAYSFDGEWKVIESSCESFPVNKTLHVEGFALTESMFLNPYMIRPPDPEDEASRPTLVSLSSFQELQSSPDNDIDIRKEIIPIGYEWTWVDHADPGRLFMKWKRESISSVVPPDQINQLGGNSGRLLIRSTNNENDTHLAAQRKRYIPEYNRHSVWGNVFCQAFKVGLASYHFEPENEPNQQQQQHSAYISYESPATGQWPPLDNGLAIPSRVPFHDISFDPDTRTFRGNICWQEDYGTSWQGMIRWEYEMIFDRDYTCIIGGRVLTYGVHSTAADNNGEELCRYGEDLIYFNARLWEIYRAEASQSQGAGDDPDGQQYRERSGLLRVGLQRQGASIRTIAMVHGILTAAQDPQGMNPVDYNL